MNSRALVSLTLIITLSGCADLQRQADDYDTSILAIILSLCDGEMWVSKEADEKLCVRRSNWDQNTFLFTQDFVEYWADTLAIFTASYYIPVWRPSAQCQMEANEMLRLLLVFFLSLLSACIILPIPAGTEKTYTDELLSAIQPGKTTRDEVIHILGEPEAIRESGSIWFYSTSRLALSLFVAWAFPNSVGAGTDEFYDYQGAVVEFEDEMVVHIEIVEHEASCTSTGICKRMRQGEAYYVSKGELDRKAKEFRGIDGQCYLYIYAPDGWNRFSVDSFRNIEINSDLYIRASLEPGPHSFRTFSPEGELEEKLIDCERGELIFVELSGEGKASRRNYSVKFVAHDIGRQALRERTLYLLP